MGSIIFSGGPLKAAVTIGIDQFSFQVNAGSPFCGVKNLTDGLHVIHISSNTNGDDDGLRYGYWFHETRGLYMRYDDVQEVYRLFQEPDDAKYEQMFQMGSHLMVSYPKIEETNWPEITNCITYEQCEKILNSNPPYVDSSMTAEEESRLLNKRLGVKADHDGKHFHYTEINFKSLDAIRPDHRMDDFMDKSHYLHHVIVARELKGHINRLLGELQFAFCNAMLFGNYGSSLQWHSIIELITFSSKLPSSFLGRFDNIVSLQLQTLPSEYSETLMNMEMWERCIFKSHQSDQLTLTKKIFESKFSPIEQDEEADEYESDTLPNIDSDYEDELDQNKPTVASGVYYVRPHEESL